MSRPWAASSSLLAGAAAAVGASACCAGPLLLVLLGIGGAWGSRLVALEAYQPYFLTAAVAFFGYAFYRLYRKPEACAVGEACAGKALEKVPGVDTAKVDFKTKRAVVAFDPAKTSPEVLTKATADAGFPSSVERVQ